MSLLIEDHISRDVAFGYSIFMSITRSFKSGRDPRNVSAESFSSWPTSDCCKELNLTPPILWDAFETFTLSGTPIFFNKESNTGVASMWASLYFSLKVVKPCDTLLYLLVFMLSNDMLVMLAISSEVFFFTFVAELARSVTAMSKVANLWFASSAICLADLPNAKSNCLRVKLSVTSNSSVISSLFSPIAAPLAFNKSKASESFMLV